jgi:hypothetical protein
MRLLNLIVAAALVLAAAHVYRIKFEATVEAERVAKLRTEIVRERDAAAALRAEAVKLENPARLQTLSDRHLTLKPLDPAQIDVVDALPFRPADAVEPDPNEPVSARGRNPPEG